MVKKCVFNYLAKYDWCKNDIKKEPPPDKLNVATEAKITAVEKYSSAWLEIMLHYKVEDEFQYDGVVFLDCMCNSGSYLIESPYPDKDRHGEIESGTSAGIHGLFLNAANKYPDRNFVLVLNDIQENQILCQLCRLELSDQDVLQEYQILENYKVVFYNEDANGLLTKQCIKNLLVNKMHMLLYYDPYQCIIDWDALNWYIKSSKVDIIINHMMMDAVRATNVAISEKSTQKYLSTYKMDDFEGLKKGLTESTNINRESYTFFRNRVKAIVKDISDNSLVASSPFFNQNNALMYDLTLISFSKKAKALFKNTIYKILAERFQKTVDDEVEQLTFDNWITTREPRKLKEHEIFSSITHFAKVVFSEFEGKGTVDNDSLNVFLVSHDFLPSTCKKDLDIELKQKHNVQISKNSEGKKIYIFA